MKSLLPVVVGVTLALAAATGTAAQADQGVLKLSIERKSLRDALNDWAQQTGYQLIAEIKGEFVAPKVEGELTAEAALQRLLEGTPLTYQWLGERWVAVNEKGKASPGAWQGTSAPGKERTAIQVARLSDSDSNNVRLAADARSSAQDARDTGGLEEIVVTAQRREQRLIDVPISMSVLSSEDLRQRGLVSREDYMRTVPSVLLRDEGVGLAEIVIRGAYGERFSTGPTVGLYLDDVPLTGWAIGGSTDIKLIDMQRVEVLRGPQGTLYGSNALSGAIRYIPNAPDTQEFTARANVGYSHTDGNGGDNTKVEGVVNIPLIEDTLALRAVAFRHENEGYVRNVAGDDPALQSAAATFGASNLAVNKDHVGTTRYSGGRVSVLWQPIADLRIGLNYVKQSDTQEDRLFEIRQVGPYQRSDYQFGDLIDGNEDALRMDLDVVNLTGEYDLGWGTLHSSTAWLEQRFIRKWDIGTLERPAVPVRPVPQISITNADVFVQEVRLASSFQGPLQFVAGVYYEDSEQPTSQATYFAGDPARNPYQAVLLRQTELDRLVTQRAAFGELSYDVTEKLEVTVGARAFEYDSRFWTRTFNTVTSPAAASDVDTEESDETFKAGIEYKPTKDALLYATWSQGFRLGRPLAMDLIRNNCDRDRDGFLDGTDISSTLDLIGSDRLDSYELGAKWRSNGGRVTVAGAVYHNDWKDIPISYIPPGCNTATTINGGSAQARGVEAEATLQATEALKFFLGVGYVNSELTSTTSLGRDGDRMNFTPEINGSAAIQYNFSIADMETSLRGDYAYVGSYYTQPGERGLRADSYDLVNLRGELTLSASAAIQIYIDNVLNSDAFTSVLGPSNFPAGYGVRLRPRTIGIGLSYGF